MTAHVSVAKSGLVCGLVTAIAGIVTVAAAGCATNTSGTGASSTTGASPSPAAPSATSTASASGTASARFVGHWQRHVSTLDITATTATLVEGLGMGPCSQGQAACSETDTLGVVSGDDSQLTLTVTAVSYGLKNGQTTPANPSPGPSTSVGDSLPLGLASARLAQADGVEGLPRLARRRSLLVRCRRQPTGPAALWRLGPDRSDEAGFATLPSALLTTFHRAHLHDKVFQESCRGTSEPFLDAQNRPRKGNS